MKSLIRNLSIGLALSIGSQVVVAQEPSADGDGDGIARVSHGGLHSLRGRHELDETQPAEPLKPIPRDRRPYPSDYIFQPPLIPHSIRGYELSTNANKCLSCHSFRRSVESGATKISVTHYATREGRVLSDVSPRRYFCLQCHVVQADADELIENSFKPVDSLR